MALMPHALPDETATLLNALLARRAFVGTVASKALTTACEQRRDGLGFSI